VTLFLKTLIGAIVWALANVVYVDLKRKGARGFGRFAAFWVGTPTTWVAFFVVPEGRRPNLSPPPDDDALLAEIRRDRALRGARRYRAGDDEGGSGSEEDDDRQALPEG
jgi:hypothetical protein